ncbi:hypothetical protein CIT292_10988 [Citrobacter youngae ATCC 29220]|uniref:Uncharacterized protein n=1 Tax=Citrobacter youngae ATCC 29220 TaxID=500640 RepID=D4BJZ4_9ENTR|nr:hypothetical protein CIT292_10988 [Citrobacter youngae ATCC 29220]
MLVNSGVRCGLSSFIGDYVYFDTTIKIFFKLEDVKKYDMMGRADIFVIILTKPK